MQSQYPFAPRSSDDERLGRTQEGLGMTLQRAASIRGSEMRCDGAMHLFAKEGCGLFEEEF